MTVTRDITIRNTMRECYVAAGLSVPKHLTEPSVEGLRVVQPSRYDKDLTTQVSYGK